jgi:hypothetical protein
MVTNSTDIVGFKKKKYFQMIKTNPSFEKREEFCKRLFSQWVFNK